jgi:hypothetical protein
MPRKDDHAARLLKQVRGEIDQGARDMREDDGMRTDRIRWALGELNAAVLNRTPMTEAMHRAVALALNDVEVIENQPGFPTRTAGASVPAPRHEQDTEGRPC